MTTLAEAEAAIRARLAANWTATDIARQNEAYEPAYDAATGAGVAFVVLEVGADDGRQASLGVPGGNLERHSGVIQVHVFVAAGSGVAAALGHAEALGALFKGQRFGGVTCRAPRVVKGDPDGQWWGVSVLIPFWYDDTI